jgi:deoxyribonuclease V
MIGSVGQGKEIRDGIEWAPVEREGEVIGASLSKGGRNPVYVSPGHGMDADTALRTIIRCIRSRIPEPIKWAHRLSNEFRKRQGLI